MNNNDRLSQLSELQSNPLLSSWIAIAENGMIVLKSGKVELGQGIGIALMQIVADELDVSMDSVQLVAGRTDLCPDQGYTSGSNSIQVGAMALRQVCAEIRHLFIEQAARNLNVQPQDVQIQDGLFYSAQSTKSLSYGNMSGEVNLERVATGSVGPKASHARHISGSSSPRPDLNQKFFGAGFIQDIELEGMLHGRMVRPPSYDATIIEFSDRDRTAIQAMPGVHTLMVCGRYLGVCAEREEQAIAAAERMRTCITWKETATLPLDQPEQDWLSRLPSLTSVVDSSLTEESIDPTKVKRNALSASTAERTQTPEQNFSQRYSKPFIAHAPIGPSCALAQWKGETLTVWTHGQGSFPMQRELSRLLELPISQVTVIHADGSGCYGHNGADDAAIDAAMLSQAAGRPVRVQWMREEEFSWSPHGSAMSVQIEATLSPKGQITQWHQQIWSHTHVQRPGMSLGLKCLAAFHREPPVSADISTDFALGAGGGGHRNAVPIYTLPQRRIDYHLVTSPTLRSSALRALGAYANVFAIESSMDELAHLAGQDPIAFRLNHLTDPRARHVLESISRTSDWQALQHNNEVATETACGVGVAFARYKNSGAYCAVVAKIKVTDRIVLDQIWVAVDAGEVIHPDGLVNQIEGGVLQAASWTLKEALHWDQTRITTIDWENYPILRFDETPRTLEVQCIHRPESPALGTGECAAGPTAAAIANALANAIGIRMRDLPLTPERLAQAVMRD